MSITSSSVTTTTDGALIMAAAAEAQGYDVDIEDDGFVIYVAGPGSVHLFHIVIDDTLA